MDEVEKAAETFIAASRALVGMAVRSIDAGPVEVTLPQHRLMVLLAMNGPQNIGQLAERLGIDQSNASRLCDRLQKLGLVTRERSDTDRRAVEVSLADPGIALLEAVNAHRLEEVKLVLAEMPAREIEAAVRALSHFADAAHEVSAGEWSVHAV